MRVRVACGPNNKGYTFSEKLAGTIDRSVHVLFGVPEPADGSYTQGDEISATFEENINCLNFNADNVIFKDKKSGTTYQVGVGCSGNKLLIFPQTDESFTDKAIEISITGLEDLNGNMRTDTVTWEFDIPEADFL